jgi:large subunit ribosomal protein L25
MAVTTNLGARVREERGKSAMRKLRADGRIPAVLYGHGEDTHAISLDAHELEILFSRISVENTLITLKVDGLKGKSGDLRALVREVQKHPAQGRLLHVDFYQIHAGEKVSVNAPIRLVGTAAGTRSGGLVSQTVDSVTVRCLPDAIPDLIEVDVTSLEIGDSVHVRDLVLPAGVEAEEDGDVTICSVGLPQAGIVDVPAVAAVEVPTGEPEVIKRRPEKDED